MSTGGGEVLRAVIFDYGGVIRREDRADYGANDDVNSLPRGALWAAIHDILEYRLSREGAIDRAAYRAAVRRALANDPGDERRAEAALRALERYSAAQPPVEPAMRALLGRLRAAGRVKLGLLSNGLHGGTARLRAAGVTALFDDAIVSGDVGLAKPDPAVFVLAATRLGVEPPTTKIGMSRGRARRASRPPPRANTCRRADRVPRERGGPHVTRSGRAPDREGSLQRLHRVPHLAFTVARVTEHEATAARGAQAVSPSEREPPPLFTGDPGHRPIVRSWRQPAHEM
jgi:putative hydrolase of the HAD superfamily